MYWSISTKMQQLTSRTGKSGVLHPGCLGTLIHGSKSVAPSRRSSAGWILESMGKWSVGVGRKHPVTMSKASFRTLFMRQV